MLSKKYHTGRSKFRNFAVDIERISRALQVSGKTGGWPDFNHQHYIKTPGKILAAN